MLHDGQEGPPDTGNPANFASGTFDVVEGTYSVPYDLDTAISPQGYFIDRIDVIAGHSDQRINQEFNVDYTLVGGATGSLGAGPGAFQYLPGNRGLATSRVRLVDGGGGPLLTGVSSLRFVFTDPNQAGDETVYREVDVFGGVVPEPGTPPLLGLGAGLLALRRRRAR